MSEAKNCTNDPIRWLEEVKKCRYLPEFDMIKLCRMLREKLMQYPSVVRVDSPVTVCGDIHGQFYDLMRLFETGGDPSNTRYVFLGDYVDRGYYSLETLTLLFLYLYCYPNQVTLLRGNHETRRISSQYGFYEECLQKYGHCAVWVACCKVFDVLPFAALIDNTFFCVHGGLSPSIRSIDQMMTIQRDVEVPLCGILSDILWSDPDEAVNSYAPNQRGAGYLFGEEAVDIFLHNNNVKMILRSHQLVMEGFKYMFGEKLATVWSAPNYCYRCGNSASLFQITDWQTTDVKLFEAVPTDDRIIPDRQVADRKSVV